VTARCEVLEPVGVHAVACGRPAVVVLWWPSRMALADTPCCFRHARHAHEAARVEPGARWEWLTTRVLPPARGEPRLHAAARALAELEAANRRADEIIGRFSR